MLILSIETSCDDTACAVVKVGGTAKAPRFDILSSVISSQIKVHKPYGGVVPTLAAREHKKNLPVVFRRALREAKTKIKDIDYIAVTQGPGLIIALWVGVNFARELAQKYNKKIIPTNHIAGHIFSNLLANEKVNFPVLNIVVSGGHTELILMKKIGNYKILGSTRDDAAGEAFDKFTKMLGLGYPGGPIVSKLAEKGDSARFPLPRPMIASKDYDFSFSGLKTAALYFFKKHPWAGEKKFLPHFCASFEQAVVDVIVSKTIRAAKEYKVKTVALSGGVSANQKLREALEMTVKKELPKTQFRAPDREFTTDNAVMIAAAAYFNRKKATSWQNLDADANLKLNV